MKENFVAEHIFQWFIQTLPGLTVVRIKQHTIKPCMGI